MPEKVITALNEVTVEWLSDVLARSGALSRGAVESFTVKTSERILSTNFMLRLTYAPGSQGDMPRNLFLKTVNIDMDDEFFGPSEVHYYARDYTGVDGVPILRAYGAQYSE